MGNKKYIFAFLITLGVFAVAIYASNYLNNKKLDEVRAVEDQLSLDILSSETQSSLLEETACTDVNSNYLTGQLVDLGDKLSYAASQNNPNNAAIENLKEYYSLLEIKDYLLMKNITAKCGTHPTFILYFYGDSDKCTDCQKTGFVLDALRQKYPSIRVYSFDYNLDQAAIKTLVSIYHLRGTLPALIINGDPYYGYQSLDELESTVPALKRLKASLSALTS